MKKISYLYPFPKDEEYWFGNQIFVEDRLTGEIKKIIRKKMIIIEEKKRIPSKKALDEVEACDVHIFEPDTYSEHRRKTEADEED